MTFKPWKWPFAAATLVWIVLLFHGKTAQAGAPVITKDIEIAQVDGKPLHVDMAVPSPAPAGKMPVVFSIHGGGWKDGTHHNLGRLYRDLTGKGFIVVSIEYRPIPVSVWPAQLEDCLRAVRWMRANASNYQADPDRFAAWGESAGAHLAACTAIYAEDPAFADPGAFAGVSAKLQAVVCGSTPADVLYSEINNLNKGVRWNLETLMGGPPEKREAAWKQATCALHARKELPPFFLYHGDRDNVIPVAESEHFADALKAVGVPVELVIVKGGGHDSFTPVDKTKPIQPDGITLLNEMVTFLEAHLKSGSDHCDAAGSSPKL